MHIKIEIRPDGSLDILQGGILLATMDPRQAFVLAASIVNNTAAQVSAAMQPPAPVAPDAVPKLHTV